jgi:hypothetical protein
VEGKGNREGKGEGDREWEGNREWEREGERERERAERRACDFRGPAILFPSERTGDKLDPDSQTLSVPSVFSVVNLLPVPGDDRSSTSVPPW